VRRWRGIGRQSRRGGANGADERAAGERAHRAGGAGARAVGERAHRAPAVGERAHRAPAVGERAAGARRRRADAAALGLVCAAAALAATGCGSSKSGESSTAASPASGSTSSTSSTGTSGKPKEGIVPNGKINYASPPANAPVQSGTVKIKYHEITIEPDTLRVKAGSTIEWVNEDPIEHNVTSEPGAPSKIASGNFGEGHTFRFTVTKPGIIHYKCTNHPATMNGTIEVVS
jgi:plastocyanin